MNFMVGQRWASISEPKMGLGVVTEVSGRRVTVAFPAVEDSRTYAAESAPLSRIVYRAGDTVSNISGDSFTVKEVFDLRGTHLYLCTDITGEDIQITEMDLSCFIQLTTPIQRLSAGQIDRIPDYRLRIATIQHLHRQQQSPVKGLLGSRTDLLPHQIYIAHEVAKRHAPRVLLADEVGLGKTIEAGMILHQQMHTGQASRVLILVPDSLMHQWLIEMLRRFQLPFSAFDAGRVLALLEADADINPFDTEQRIIAPISLFMDYPELQEDALAASWDLVIVDEAHHLAWKPEQASPEYQFVEQLAAKTAGLLLLTATPEQVGLAGHFARLRLLDPARFHDLDVFIEEQSQFAELNVLVQQLVAAGSLTDTLIAPVQVWLGDRTPALGTDADSVIDVLLDQHGTGRVLFRNTRAAIKGFPQRQLHSYPLDCPKQYLTTTGLAALRPEQSLPEDLWLDIDPRVSWLIKTLQSLKGQKVLVICHYAETALALDKHLNLRAGIRAASFYEDLTLIERDRAAAYFAEPDQGAQVLICSEIGSEGRNFQFAHHLVLFDLPEDPDLLEQRIGRLDRIGQTESIQIHAPYLRDTAQEALFHWLNKGIGIFEQSCSAGHPIYSHFRSRLFALLETPDPKLFATLVSETEAFAAEAVATLHEGRDALLERNSCRMAPALELITLIEQESNTDTLQNYMESVFTNFGLETEPHSAHATIIKPNEHMVFAEFPGLKEDGNTVTFDRRQALSRDDMDFLTWEHPMVTESMELIRAGEHGNLCLAALPLKALPPATLLLEMWFTVETQANNALQVGRFLPLQPFRLLLNQNGQDLGHAVSFDQLNNLVEPIGKQKTQPIVAQIRPTIESMYQLGIAQATTRLPDIIATATAQARNSLEAEIARLEALQLVNQHVRPAEIAHQTKLLSDNLEAIGRADILCQGLRVLITRHP